MVGVLGDSRAIRRSVQAAQERKFIRLIGTILTRSWRLTAGLDLRVQNTLKGDGSEMPFSLKFTKHQDFEPAAIVAQAPALKVLLETRGQLRDFSPRPTARLDLNPCWNKS